jgi:hypothetical protein
MSAVAPVETNGLDESTRLVAELQQIVGTPAANAQLQFLEQMAAEPDERLRLLRETVNSLRASAAAHAPVTPGPNVDGPESAAVPAVGAEPATGPSRPTWNDTVNAPSGRPRFKRARPGVVAAIDKRPWLKRDYYKMPNKLADAGLLTVMAEPVLKAYLVACRWADAEGVVWFSHQALAAKIGCRDRQYGKRVMRRLTEAGLLRLVARGRAKGQASRYQLTPLDSLDLTGTHAVLSRPMRGATDPPAASTVGRADPQ